MKKMTRQWHFVAFQGCRRKKGLSLAAAALFACPIPEKTPVNDHLCFDVRWWGSLELVELLDGLAGTGKDAEDVEADL
jgi:hypothetical protein